jgi:hypothetical protein
LRERVRVRVKFSGRFLFQCLQNSFLQAVPVFHYFAIPESHDPVSWRFQPVCTHIIVVCLFLVLPAIEFDEQLSFQADENYEILADRDLPTKLVAQQPMASQQVPQDTLGIRGVFS